MKLFGRQNKTVEVPPELQPYYESSTGTPQPALWRWGRWVIVALLVIGVGLLVYFLGPWHSSDNSSKNKPAAPPSSSSSSGGVSTKPSAPPTTSTQSGTGGGNSTESGTKSSGSAGNQSSSQNGSQQQLVNTGPGSTVAIFIGTVAIGVIAYELRLHRRATR